MNKRAKCKGCGRPIVWVKTSKGKNMPVDPEEVTIITMGGVTFKGRVVHWSTCPESDRFKKGTEPTQGLGPMQWRCPKCGNYNLKGHLCNCGTSEDGTGAAERDR
ncbi:MAG: hypothetical protein JRJ39_00540 [Deltaproteobacteria bacterium]|nr:hypothetical protein [Deltaproteobacteria bacterium]MBW1845597.1 hypothetical protein [Deltaproteobacteria bacterium]MBW2032025.1 hypothetical protein [Deltaproteobacteria bacterium]